MKSIRIQHAKESYIPDDAWTVGKSVGGLYKITGYLGHGGMGTVYQVKLLLPVSQIYAVKTLHANRFRDEKLQKEFTEELKTWIDLPEHPNLTACRFFREIDDRLAIFSEYVDGGSLQQWIDGEYFSTPAEAIGIAIQFALGLQAAHDHGVIHQDIKPGNVLMTRSGIAKISDFGLSRARFAGGIDGSREDPALQHLVTSRGMTLAYCSPEQASGKKLSYASDMWSYALSILQMFNGKMSWRMGPLALATLENLMNNRPEPPRIPIPSSVADILRKCLENDPKNRFGSMDEIARKLMHIHRKLTGRRYPAKRIPKKSAVEPSLQKATFRHEDDPGIQWLTQACHAARKEVPQQLIKTHTVYRGESARVLSTIELLKEAIELYASFDIESNPVLKKDLAAIYKDCAMQYRKIRQYEPAHEMMSRALPLLYQILEIEKTVPVMNEIASVSLIKLQIVHVMGQWSETLKDCRSLIELLESTPESMKNDDTQGYLSKAYLTLGSTFYILNDYKNALLNLNKARELIENLVFEKKNSSFEEKMAVVYQNLAVVCNMMSEFDLSLKYLEKSNEIRRKLHENGCDPEISRDYAHTLMNYAITQHFRKQYSEAILYYDRSISLLEAMVEKYGENEYGADLMLVLCNKAATLQLNGEYQAELDLLEKSIAVHTTLIVKKGRIDLLESLAISHFNQAQALICLGKNKKALFCLEKTIRIRRWMIYQLKRKEIIGDYYWAKACRAQTLIKMNVKDKNARSEFVNYIRKIKKYILKTNRFDLKDYLTNLEPDMKKAGLGSIENL